MPSADVFSAIPLHLASPDDFAQVREFFASTGFSDTSLCQHLRIADMSELGLVRWEEIGFDTWTAALAWAVRVFVRGQSAEEGESRLVCGEDVFRSLGTLGLIRTAKSKPSHVLSPVWVYPAAGFVIVSDRRDDPEGGVFAPPEDVVFPAIYAGTLRFLEVLPQARGGDALDLCGGSGIGALQLSRTARNAETADLTERSCFFAEFNARLNSRAVRSWCGDLYAPVAGRQFDLITAHPPFVPATNTNLVYRDGGESGEAVTKRIIEGLPSHLRAGGTGVILCIARDTEEKAFEQRVAEWLGEAASEFDVVFGWEKILTVEEVVESMRKRGMAIDDQEARQLYQRLRGLGTRHFVYGATFIHRTTNGQPVGVPLRVRLTLDGTAADFERLIAWRRWARSVEFPRWLREAKPRLAPNLELTVRHLMQDGGLMPAEFVFSITGGFEARMRPDGWVVPLVARLDGQRSVEEVFNSALAADELPTGFPLAAFSDLVGKMIERDFLRVELPPVPPLATAVSQG